MLPKPRVWIATAVILGLCCLALWVFLCRADADDPLVKGKRLSTHLLFVFGPAGNDGERGEGRDAIRALGTNCAPLLKRWITNDLPPWRMGMAAQMLWKWGFVTTALPPEDPRLIAVGATDLLDTNGWPLFADLVAATTNSNSRLADAAAKTLAISYLELNHIPVETQMAVRPSIENAISVLQARSNTDATLRRRAAFLRKTLHRPSLMAFRLDTAAADEQANTLRLLSRRQEQFAEMLPRLLEHLQSTNAMLAENAAICLRNYGAQAKIALPALEKAGTHPDDRVREEAGKARAMITAQLGDPLLHQ